MVLHSSNSLTLVHERLRSVWPSPFCLHSHLATIVLLILTPHLVFQLLTLLPMSRQDLLVDSQFTCRLMVVFGLSLVHGGCSHHFVLCYTLCPHTWGHCSSFETWCTAFHVYCKLHGAWRYRGRPLAVNSTWNASALPRPPYQPGIQKNILCPPASAFLLLGFRSALHKTKNK